MRFTKLSSNAFHETTPLLTILLRHLHFTQWDQTTNIGTLTLDEI